MPNFLNKPADDNAPRLILLPGMDGTGQHFEHLIAQFPLPWHATILNLNHLVSNTYDAQIQAAVSLVGNESVVVVAESYAGPIAYELAKRLPHQIKHIVFIASFITCPAPLAKLAAKLPSWLWRPNFIPFSIANQCLFGGCGTRENFQALKRVVLKVGVKTLAERMNNIARLAPPNFHLSVPVTYIRPELDYLVNSRTVKLLASFCQNYREFTVKGGHFLTLTQPHICFELLANIIANGEIAHSAMH